MNTKRKYLFIELVILFIGIPLLLLSYQTPLLKLCVLITGIFITIFYLYKSNNNIMAYFTFDKKSLHIFYFIKVVSFILIIMLLGFFFRKEHFLVLQYPLVFIPLLIVGYPLVSVLPQEIIYRLFFYQRYGILFRNKRAAILINAVLFAFMHMIYKNPTAVIFTFIGGILLSNTYLRGRALILTVIEHSVYGYAVFLSGYGPYFLNENIFRLFLQQ